MVGVTRGLDRTFQANFERRKRVLSTFFIGGRFFHQGVILKLADLNRALAELRFTILANCADTARFLWGSLRDCSPAA